MSSMNRAFRTLISTTVAVVVTTSCMTLNVNVQIPESAVQKATDDYVRELYRAKEKGRTPPSPKQSSFDFFISGAFAEEISFKIESAKALKIRDKMASRLDEVLTQKKSGVLGESNTGLIVLKSPEKLKKLLMKKIEKLVLDENTDREDLYAEVLKANNAPKNRLIDIQKSFARSFQAESPSGTWIQSSENVWAQKP